MQKPEASAKKNRGAVLQEGGSGRLIRLWTKIDRCPAAAPEGFLPLSAERGDGMEELGRRMAEAALGGASPPGGEAVIDSLRQKELLERARRALAGFRAGLAEGVPYDLLSVDLKEALDALGEITGEVTTADILERMFRDFCVGK
jgi:tRNA modification GTPase